MNVCQRDYGKLNVAVQPTQRPHVQFDPLVCTVHGSDWVREADGAGLPRFHILHHQEPVAVGVPGWCREEPECAAASFSFVVNPLAPIQETLCLLQNETMASNPTAKPKRAVSLYYMVKLHIDSGEYMERVCRVAGLRKIRQSSSGVPQGNEFAPVLIDRPVRGVLDYGEGKETGGVGEGGGERGVRSEERGVGGEVQEEEE
ncbi:hypothetical protein O3P69_013360 [Scylla paramamosain]|uniref:Uncharacterized protein n=1 Tax=Scylla paramamosain TaxID=85552 RepID=A0AAW0U4H3_SCYPA